MLKVGSVEFLFALVAHWNGEDRLAHEKRLGQRSVAAVRDDGASLGKIADEPLFVERPIVDVATGRSCAESVNAKRNARHPLEAFFESGIGRSCLVNKHVLAYRGRDLLQPGPNDRTDKRGIRRVAGAYFRSVEGRDDVAVTSSYLLSDDALRQPKVVRESTTHGGRMATVA